MDNVCFACGHGPEDHIWSDKDDNHYCQEKDCECDFYITMDWGQ